MTLKVPCERELPADRDGIYCCERNLCDHCNAIRILKAACLGVADRLEVYANSKEAGYDFLWPSIGRLRADVARVEG